LGVGSAATVSAKQERPPAIDRRANHSVCPIEIGAESVGHSLRQIGEFSER